MKLGFVGLGMMGKYMALNLLKKNYQVIGYNRSKKVLRELKKSGLVTASSLRQVAEGSEVIILMLPTSKETHEVVFGTNGLAPHLKKDTIVIDMSTSNPVETTRIMKRLKKRGVEMMDAPVSRGQRAAVDGTLSVMVGGSKKSFKRCLPVFKSVGEVVEHLGPFGSGMYVKSLNNFLFAMNLLASAQGLVVMKKNKIDLHKAIEVICESSGNNHSICSAIKRNIGKKKPQIGFYLRYMAKDMQIFNDVIKNQKIMSVLSKPVLDFYKKVEKSHGNEDAMYVFEHLIEKNREWK